MSDQDALYHRLFSHPLMVERIRGSDAVTLDRWAERLFDASTIAEVFDSNR